jgi:hypothetical protein
MLIPFNVEVVEKLKSQNKPRIANYEDIMFNEEAPGILNWLIEGWYEKINMSGLCPPPEVQAAINEYKTSLDSIQRWIDEQCLKFEPNNPDLLEPFSAIFNTYNTWATLNGEPTYKNKGFAKRLDDKGLKTVIGSGNVKFRQGVKIKEELLITDSYRYSNIKQNTSRVMDSKENQSLSVIGNSPVTIGNSKDLDSAEKRILVKNAVLKVAASNIGKLAPRLIVIDELKNVFDEQTVDDLIKILKEIGEIMEPEYQRYKAIMG